MVQGNDGRCTVGADGGDGGAAIRPMSVIGKSFDLVDGSRAAMVSANA